MSKRNVYLTQASILRETPMFTTAYLPYGAGALWAYARQAPEVAASYELREIIFLRETVSDVVARLENPWLVGFSCYVWSTEYNKALARAVKERFPNCLILFGGHNVPAGGGMLEEFPFIDFLIHGEGEIPFQSLLVELSKPVPDFTAVRGLSYRTEQGTATNADIAPKSIADFPSPYLEGLFDPIVAAHPEIQWSTVWETNRGCPLHCAYCDWGQHKARVRELPMDRLLAEVEWMGANKVEYIWCADANFGILERDEAIIDALVASKERTGYPYTFLCQSTKTWGELLFRIFEKITKSGLDKLGPNLALQSMSPEALRNIGRKNQDDETIRYWLRRFREAGIRTHTDLIMGLPGETLQSFRDGLEKVFHLGQHGGIVCFPCNVLPNAAMADPAYREKHGIRTRRQILRESLGYVPEAEQIDEFVDIVDQTKTMPHEDLRTTFLFALIAAGSHCYGLLRLLAMYLHTENIASYGDFYQSLLDFVRARPDSLIGDVMRRIETEYDQNTDNQAESTLQIPGFSLGRMIEDQYFFARSILEFDRFFQDVESFLCEQNYALPPELLEQLLRYQRESIVLPGASEKYLEFGYDFPSYFAAVYDGKPVPLEQTPVKLRLFLDYDVSNLMSYYNAIVRIVRYSGGAFYGVEGEN